MQPAFLNCQTHTYRRKAPEKEVLYQAISDNLETLYVFSDDSNELFFVVTPSPTDEDVKHLADTVTARIYAAFQS